MKNNASSKLKLILSMTVFGTLGLFTRNIAVTSGELSLYRAVLAAVLIVAFLTLTRQKLDWEGIKKDLKYVLSYFRPSFLINILSFKFQFILHTLA